MRSTKRRFIWGLALVIVLIAVLWLLIPDDKPPPPLPFDTNAYVSTTMIAWFNPPTNPSLKQRIGFAWLNWIQRRRLKHPNLAAHTFPVSPMAPNQIQVLLNSCMEASSTRYLMPTSVAVGTVQFGTTNWLDGTKWVPAVESALETNTVQILDATTSRMVADTLVLIRFPEQRTVLVLPKKEAAEFLRTNQTAGTVKKVP